MAHYYPDQFPSFWQQLDTDADNGTIFSTREVYNELKGTQFEHIKEWVKSKNRFFRIPSSEETNFVAEILSDQHSRQLISQKSILRGSPVADPFLIACAKVHNATLVTQERLKPNAAKIPNICKKFSVPVLDFQGFLRQKKWIF